MSRNAAAMMLVAAIAGCQAAPPTAPAVSTLDLGTPVVPYEAIDLGALPDRDKTEATAFNNTGQVVGWSEGRGNPPHAFLWQDGVMIDLDSVPGLWSRATDINDLGQVVGQRLGHDGFWHPFLWANGAMVDLHPGAFNFNPSVSPHVNEAGQVVWTGNAVGDPNGLKHAFLWSDGVVTDLLGGPATVAAINDRGQIVGTALGRVYLWEAGTVRYLPTLGGSANAIGINNRGQVVGSSRTSSSSITHAVLWEDGEIRDLGVLPGDSLSGSSVITQSGQVAGISYNDIYSGGHPFSTQQGVVAPMSPTYPTDPLFVSLAGLNEHGTAAGIRRGGREAVVVENGVTWILPGVEGTVATRANAINQRGDVVGFVYTDNFAAQRAILWRRASMVATQAP